MDELNQELDKLETSSEGKLQVKDRFAKLTEKGIAEEKGRKEAEAKLQTEAQARMNAEKERDFFKSFSAISAKHPAASAYQEQILERVNKGYDPEEAVLAVLAKEGKLDMPQVQTQTQTRMDITGGSAQTNVNENLKNAKEMSQAERVEALLQAEREGANLLKF